MQFGRDYPRIIYAKLGEKCFRSLAVDVFEKKSHYKSVYGTDPILGVANFNSMVIGYVTLVEYQ